MSSLPEEPEDSSTSRAPLWMITFADLATLMMTFFVMLFAFSTMNETEVKRALGSMREALGGQASETKAPEPPPLPTVIDLGAPANQALLDLGRDPRAILTVVKKLIDKEQLQDEISAEETNRGIVLRLKDSVLFNSGSDQLAAGSDEVLRTLADLTAAYPEGVSIEGHTDDLPINTSRFRDNWSLGAARGVAMLGGMRRFRDLSRNQIRVVTYAETQPLEPNTNETTRARNRRVEFVFEKPGALDVSWPTADRPRTSAADLANRAASRVAPQAPPTAPADTTAPEAASP